MGGLRGKGKKGKRDGKQAALARGAFHLNPPSVGLDNGSGDGQAQARPAFTLGPRRSRAVKTPEDLFLIFLGDSDSRVRNPKDGRFFIPAERDF